MKIDRARDWVRGRARRLGIRARMLVIALAVGLPFLAFLVFNTAQQAQLDRRHATQQMRLNAALAAARLDDKLGDIRQLLNALSDSLDTEATAVTRNELVLKHLRPRFPEDVSSVSIWALDGSSLGSSASPQRPLGDNVSERGFFREALHSTAMVGEAPVRLAAGLPWNAFFALPVRRDGQVIAVLCAASDLATLQNLVDAKRDLPDGAVVTTVDLAGRVVARSLDADALIGRQSFTDPAYLPRRFAEGQGSYEGQGIDGAHRIFGFARIRSMPWLVYVGIPVDVAMAPTRAEVRRSLTLGGLLLAIGLAVAALIAGRIARPLQQLSADARMLGDGHLEHRSKVRTSGEIGTLAVNLNRMAQSLDDQTRSLRHSEERLKLALGASDQSTFDWDLLTERAHYDAQASLMRGGPASAMELSSAEMLDEVHPDDRAVLQNRLDEALSGMSPNYDAEFRVQRHAGGWMWIRSLGRVVDRDAQGRALRLVGIQADISDRKHAEAEWRRRAEFDPLTGLPNRALFQERLRQALFRATRSRRPIALLFIDIDHFKAVNDSLGHEAGDELLKVVATRLLAGVRASDTVARLAGDEFTVILEALNSSADALAVARKLVDAMPEPVALGGAADAVATCVTVSIGVAFAATGEHDGAAWLRRADQALYDAKRRGRNGFAVFDPDLAFRMSV